VSGFARDEIEAAFRHFQDAADRSAKSGDWAEWSECFTEDADYWEHHYGRFKGRAEILAWINATMAQPVIDAMRSFPIEWYVIDEDRGWVICSVLNRMDDPGDGSVHEVANWTLLKYAGNGLFSYEEDVYNPADFATMIEGWLAARKGS
jgi:SnoaL-like protein